MKRSIKLSLVAGAILASSSFFVGCSSSGGSSSASALGGAAGGGKNAPFLMLTDHNATATDAAGNVLISTDAMNTILAGSEVHFAVTMSSDYNVTIPGSMVVDVDNSGDYNASIDKFVSDFGFSQLTGIGGGQINVGTTVALAKKAKAEASGNAADLAKANAMLNYFKNYDVTKVVKKADLNATGTAGVEAQIKDKARQLLETIIETTKVKASQSALADMDIDAGTQTLFESAADNNFTATAADIAAANTTAATVSAAITGITTADIDAAVTLKNDQVNILRELEASGEMTEAQFNEAAIKTTDTNNNITSIITSTAPDANTTAAGVDGNVTAADATSTTIKAATDTALATRPVLLKLAVASLSFGSESVRLNESYDSFTKSIAVTNTSTVNDYFSINIPVDKAQIDKTATDSTVTLAVKIAETANANNFAAFIISGAELVTTTDANLSKRALALNFNSNTTITVASSMPALTSALGATSATATVNNMTNTDFGFDMSTVLNNLSSNSSKINTAVTALNAYLVQTNAYTVDLGFDANVTTDFADHNFTIGSTTHNLKGVQGTISVNNPNYNKAPVKLSDISPFTLAEGVAMTSVDFSAAFSDTETLTITSTTLPTGLVLSTGGILSGIPTVPGDTNVTVTATDSASQTVQSSVVITIGDNPTPTETSAITTRTFSVDAAGTFDLSGHFSDNDSLTFALSGCTLPTGITFDSNGTMSGTATAEATVTGCIVTATDTISQSVAGTAFGVSVVTDPLAGYNVLTAIPNGQTVDNVKLSGVGTSISIANLSAGEDPITTGLVNFILVSGETTPAAQVNFTPAYGNKTIYYTNGTNIYQGPLVGTTNEIVTVTLIGTTN